MPERPPTEHPDYEVLVVRLWREYAELRKQLEGTTKAYHEDKADWDRKLGETIDQCAALRRKLEVAERRAQRAETNLVSPQVEDDLRRYKERCDALAAVLHSIWDAEKLLGRQDSSIAQTCKAIFSGIPPTQEVCPECRGTKKVLRGLAGHYEVCPSCVEVKNG